MNITFEFNALRIGETPLFPAIGLLVGASGEIGLITLLPDTWLVKNTLTMNDALRALTDVLVDGWHLETIRDASLRGNEIVGTFDIIKQGAPA
jgi:hypothetical protein